MSKPKYIPHSYQFFIDFHKIPKCPETLIWDVTFRCNLKCIHCYNSDRYFDTSKQKELNTEQAKVAIRKLADFGFKHIHLLGGEPLIRKDIVELASYTTKKGLRMTINTNGVLLDYDLAKKLADSGVDQITISIDGAKKETNDYIRGHGTFTKILNAVEAVNKTRENYTDLELGFAFTMTKINLSEMPEIVRLANEYGIDIVDFMELYISGNANRNTDLLYSVSESLNALEKLSEYIKDHKKEFKDIIIQMDVWYPTAIYLERKYRIGLVYHPRNMGCMAVVDRWYMESNGNIHPCGITTNPIYDMPIRNREVIIENKNILEVSSMEEITGSKYFTSFLELRDDKQRFEKKLPCATCDYFSFCIPCPFINYGADVIKECMEVFKRERKFEESVKKLRPVVKTSHLLSDSSGIKVYDKELDVYRSIEGIGIDILEYILQKKEVVVEDVINHVYSKYDVDKRQVERDVIDFVWWLQLLDVLKLEKIDK